MLWISGGPDEFLCEVMALLEICYCLYALWAYIVVYSFDLVHFELNGLQLSFFFAFFTKTAGFSVSHRL